MFGSGLLIGIGASVVAARWQIKRSLAKVRIAERRARTAERLAEIGAMTGGLAHEIKNPLSTIGLNAQLLAEGVEELPADRPVEPDVKNRLIKRIGSLRREAERLRGILQDFLAYAGELHLERKSTDLRNAVEELVDFFAPQAARQGVRLRADLPDVPLMSSVDIPHLKQALLNLMLNAVQAMSLRSGQTGGNVSNAPAPADGTGPNVTTEAGMAKELIIRASAYEERLPGQQVERGVRIRVTDTGPGMNEETLKRLFTPYFTTKAGGSGLGLATTRRIVEAHQGRIEAYSKLGVGTEFTVTLPGEVPGAGVVHTVENQD
jgi:signal transduction histidine kinase